MNTVTEHHEFTVSLNGTPHYSMAYATAMPMCWQSESVKGWTLFIGGDAEGLHVTALKENKKRTKADRYDAHLAPGQTYERGPWSVMLASSDQPDVPCGQTDQTTPSERECSACGGQGFVPSTSHTTGLHRNDGKGRGLFIRCPTCGP